MLRRLKRSISVQSSSGAGLDVTKCGGNETTAWCDIMLREIVLML